MKFSTGMVFLLIILAFMNTKKRIQNFLSSLEMPYYLARFKT